MTDESRRRARAALARALHPRDGAPEALLDLDPTTWIGEAEWGGVAGIVADSLSKAGLLDRLDTAASDRLRTIVLGAEMTAARLEEAFRLAHDALEALGVSYVTLKGAALARLVYARPALRPMSDIDLLIDPRRIDDVLAALPARGFKLPSARSLELSRTASKCVPVKPPLDLDVELELHWSIVQEGRNHADVDRLFAEARPVQIAGRTSQALGPFDLLLHQTLHHSYHAFQPKLMWLLDLALLHRDPPPLEPLLARAESWGMVTALALSVRHLEKVFPGVCERSYAGWARGQARSRRLLRIAGDDDPIGLLRGWKSSRTQLLLKLATLDSGRALRWQLAAWGRRFARFGGRPGESTQWE